MYIHEAILLTLLANHSSSNPLPFNDLHLASKMSKKGLHAALDKMFYATPAVINRATITKKGETQMVVWPTCVVVHQGIQTIGITGEAFKRKQAVKASLPRPPRFNELTKLVLDKVVTQPGISRMDLFSYAMSTQFIKDASKIKSAIGNLTFKGFIVSSGKAGNLTYTPGVAK